ncbi:MAG: adenosine deaminase [Lachnospirales bacterium]
MTTKEIINNLKCFIDLHLHLDGSISVKSTKELAKIENINLPKNDEDIKNMLMVSPNCRDLNEYLEKFDFSTKLMQSEKSLYLSAFNLCKELEDNGYIYAEIRFAPQKHCLKGLNQETVVKSVINGIKDSGFKAGVILCAMRDGSDNYKENIETVKIAQKYLDRGVCGLDLAGAEALFPNEKYKYVFDLARDNNIPFTIHSGEALGYESVDLAIEYGAKRIGHGVRSVENIKTIDKLLEYKIPLEVCPTSNVNTCVYESVKDVPVKYLMDKGVILTINSDNMSVSDTNVKNEFLKLDLKLDDVRKILLNSANSSFTDNKTKIYLKNIINTDFAIKVID